ncbi:MAG TPA: hypothetical protein DEA27_02735 [Candidatus Moranbacteria bacterium]|nr:hypothetical protein [Candidatus Moranbacteria bacterium]
MKLQVRKFLFFYGPLFFWMAMIFLLSSIPGSGSQEYNFLAFLERKSAHLVEYFILFILCIRVLWLHFREEDEHILAWGILASFVYAVFDEIHQLFVFGRSGRVLDVGIDLSGIILGAIIVWLYEKRRKRIFHRQ